jgi:hypothetical protein
MFGLGPGLEHQIARRVEQTRADDHSRIVIEIKADF